MDIKVTKLTNEDLLHKVNSFTTGKESKQSLKDAYRYRHSTIRTQIFLVECYGIPQYVAYHLRTHFSLYMMAPMEYGWMKSKRIDRGGSDFRDVCNSLANRLVSAYNDADTEKHRDASMSVRKLPDEYDRYASTDFGFMISAEGLMTMADKRLCVGAVSKETREVVEIICNRVKDCDPNLYPHLVKPCVATGICRECKCCGFIRSDLFAKIRANYKKLFVE